MPQDTRSGGGADLLAALKAVGATPLETPQSPDADLLQALTDVGATPLRTEPAHAGLTDPGSGRDISTDPASVRVTGGPEPFVGPIPPPPPPAHRSGPLASGGDTFNLPGFSGAPAAQPFGSTPVDMPAVGAVRIVKALPTLAKAAGRMAQAGPDAVSSAAPDVSGPLMSDDTAGAANELIEGTFQAMSPLIAAGAVLNPGATAVGLLYAKIAQTFGEEAAEAMKASPEMVRLAGNLSAAAVGTKVGRDIVKANLADAAKLVENSKAAALAIQLNVESAQGLAGKVRSDGTSPMGRPDVPGVRFEQTMESPRPYSTIEGIQKAKEAIKLGQEAPVEFERPTGKRAPVERLSDVSEHTPAFEELAQRLANQTGENVMVETDQAGKNPRIVREAKPETPAGPTFTIVPQGETAGPSVTPEQAQAFEAKTGQDSLQNQAPIEQALAEVGAQPIAAEEAPQPASNETPKPEVASPARPGAVASYEDFKAQYEQAFADANRYTPDQIGNDHYIQKMADLADAHPEFVDRLETEQEEAARAERINKARYDVSHAPSEAQVEAGNYAKGHVHLHGLDVTIETAKGGPRTGVGEDGKRWSVEMPADYGYVRRTSGADGEQVDVSLGPLAHTETPDVYVIDQHDPRTGKFDETKAMIGFESRADAIEAYDNGFSDGSGPSRRGAVVEASISDFKEWLHGGETQKPAAWAFGGPSIQALDQREGSLQQSEKPSLQELRGQGDNNNSVDPGQLRGIRQGGRDSSVSTTSTGQNRQQRELRTRQPSLGDKERAGSKSTEEQTTDIRRQNNADGGVGGRSRTGSIDAARSAMQGEDVGRGGNNYASSRRAPAVVESQQEGTTNGRDDTGQLPASPSAGSDAVGAGSENPLEAIPAQPLEGTGEQGAVGDGDSASRVEDGIRDGAAIVEGSIDVSSGGGESEPVPVSVSPSGATHDPGRPALDYTLTQDRVDDIIRRGDVTRAKDNLAAIRLIQQLRVEGRWATADEQDILSSYVGWGSSAVSQYLNTYQKPGWSSNEIAIWNELRQLPADEREKMGGSTLNAHYTFDLYPPIWEAVTHAGFSGGRVLEPSVGVGHAIGFMPPDVRGASRISAVELDPFTAAIAGHLYPSVKVQTTGYEKAIIPRNTQDLVISNVPFGNYKVVDPSMAREVQEASIHDYFFAKALDHVRVGGLVVFITSRYTMDGQANAVRRYLADRADFLGAVRLPNNAFDKTAKTEVVTDLIVLRKREPNTQPSDATQTFIVSEPTNIGGWRAHRARWYTEHPEFVLGTEEMTGKQYRQAGYNVTAPREGIKESIATALKQIIPPGTYSHAVRVAAGASQAPVQLDAGTFKGGELRARKGGVDVVEADGTLKDATPMRQGKPDTKTIARIHGMIGIRDQLRRVVAVMQEMDATPAAIKKEQATLDKLYKAFVKANGHLNTPTNRRAFSTDVESENLLALEKVEIKATETERGGKKVLSVKPTVVGISDIFTKRVINAATAVRKAETSRDAMMMALAQRGSLDWALIATALDLDVSAAQDALVASRDVFRQPDGSFATAEAYLSGDVVSKLEDARAAGPEFDLNVQALIPIQPTPKTRADLESGAVAVTLGSGWVDTNDFRTFLAEQLGRSPKEVHLGQIVSSVYTAWTVTASQNAVYSGNVHALAVGHSGGMYGLVDMFTDALNLQQPELGHYERVDKDKRVWVPDQKATMAARANLESLNATWQAWVLTHEEVVARALDTYNARFNRTVSRTLDGSHMTYPGMATLYDGKGNPMKFHAHQNRVVWRILSTGNTLMAHEVGAGKTFAAIAAAMEMRRTGRATKPMIVVPTYLLGQWRFDIKRLYPNAKVASFDENDLVPAKRKAAMARIAFNDWDIVLVPHSSFGLLKVSDDRMTDMLNRWIAELKALEKAVGTLEEEDAKKIARQRKRIEEKAAKMSAKLKEKSKDKALTWEQLGVDALFVDEAHMFKNLFFYTKIEGLRGLSRSEADRSLDLFVKVQMINEQSKYRNLVLMTATPLMNSMAEVYTMQRYLQPQTLHDAGFEHFDAWYHTFAEADTRTEQQPDGTYRDVRRLRKFRNLTLLAKMVGEVMDYVGWEDMPYLKLPKIAGGKIDIVATPQHPIYPALQQWFAQRMLNIKEKPPKYNTRTKVYTAPARPDPLTGEKTAKLDNILTIMGDAKKAAIDVRLVVGDRAKDVKDSRIQTAANRMFEIWKAEKKNKGVQLMFLDMGTPKDADLKPMDFLSGVTIETAADEVIDDEADAARSQEEEEEGPVDEADDRLFNLYDAMKAALVKRGVPEREIVYIHQARNVAQRTALFTAAQKGDVRFVFASTDKGGVGMNIQERLAAIHELDTPRAGRPGDLRQRMGRGIRQGNIYPEVKLVRYVTKGTTDEWLWGMLSTKDFQFRQFLRGDATALEELDPASYSLDEAQMLASGDPRTVELVETKAKLARLEAQASAAERAIASATAAVSDAKFGIQRTEQELAQLTHWLQTAPDLSGDNFSMQVGERTFTKRKDATDALIAQAKIVNARQPEGSVRIGTIGGLPITARVGKNFAGNGAKLDEVTFRVDGTAAGIESTLQAGGMSAPEVSPEQMGLGTNPAVTVQNAYDAIRTVAKPKRERALEEYRSRLATAEHTVANPPKAIEEARVARDRVTELETELKADAERQDVQLKAANTRKAEATKFRAAFPADADLSDEAIIQKHTAPKPDGGVTLQMAVVPGAHLLTPILERAIDLTRQDAGILRKAFAPASIGLAPLAADVLRVNNAAHDQRVERVRLIFQTARNAMEAWSKDQVTDFWRVMENEAQPSILPEHAQAWAIEMRTLLREWQERLNEAGLLESYMEHYWPHEWKRSSQAGNLARRLFGRRPIQGPESYRKQRTIVSMSVGLAKGLEPVSWNPAEQLQRKIYEMSRSLMAREAQKEMIGQKLQVFVRAGAKRPEAIADWEQVPEAALGVRRFFTPGEVGMTELGRYYAPPEIVRILKNFTSPGLAGQSAVFDLYNQLGNISTQFLLGMSTYHFWMIGLEAIISKQSIIVEALSRGDREFAAKKLKEVGPVGLIKDYIRGRKAKQAFYAVDAIAKLYGTKSQTAPTRLHTEQDLMIQGGYAFGRADIEHARLPQKFRDDLTKVRGAMQRFELGTAALAGGKAILHGAGAAFEVPTDLIMNHWVQYLKAAAFLDMAELEIRTMNQNASAAEVRRVLGRASDAADDRFGQIRYANLFWDNRMKQGLMAGFLSVGWQVGSLRHGARVLMQAPRTARVLKRRIEGGGAGPNPPRLLDLLDDLTPQERSARGFDPNYERTVQREAAWLFNLVLFVAISDAVYQVLNSGILPGVNKDGDLDSDLLFRDLFHPRNGEIDSHGREQRDNLISYMKDYLSVPRHPIRSAQNKMKPLLRTLWEAYDNADFYGDAMRDPNDPVLLQLWDTLKFVAEQHMPIGFQNAYRRSSGKRDQGWVEFVKSEGTSFLATQAVPFTPAPAEDERSHLENYLASLIPPKRRTKVDAQKAEARREIRLLDEANETAQANAVAAQASITGRSLRALRKNARLGPLLGLFKPATWPEAVKAMGMASPDEKAALEWSFRQKGIRAMREARTAEQRLQIQADLRRLLAKPVGAVVHQ